MLYERHTKPLGQLISLGVVSSRKIVFNPQYEAYSSEELGDKLPSVFGTHVRWGAVRVHLTVQERFGDIRRRGCPERYGASQFRQPDGDHQHKLVSTLRFRNWFKMVHSYKLRGPRRRKQLQIVLMFPNGTFRLCARGTVRRDWKYVNGHVWLLVLPLKNLVHP